MNKSRTDIAVEDMNLGFAYDIDREIKGMIFKKLTVDEELSKKIKKNQGLYYNIDNIDLSDFDEDLIYMISSVVQDMLNHLELENKELKVLVVGLGNDLITPDSLGPLVTKKIDVTSHLNDESLKYEVSALIPGVMGKTGLETSEIVKGMVNEFSFDLVIVVDALACSVPSRMCHSIQLSTAGINPGSGVGNNRKEISKAYLGVPVIAIGVPTVCDVDVFTDEIENNFFVTPNNIDEAMIILSNIISDGINISLSE
jgi:spore protease